MTTDSEWENAHDTIRAAADIGTACAWIEVFARVVVPLGAPVWRTDKPEVGRVVVDRGGVEMKIEVSGDAEAWSEAARAYPESYAWRYID